MNCIFSLPCFCSDSNYILNKFSCLVYAWFQYLHMNSKDKLNCIWTPLKGLLKLPLTLASEYLVQFCNFCPHLSSSIVFSVLKLAQIFCINIFEHFFSWKLTFSNSLVNWEKFGSTAKANIQKSQYSINFINWKYCEVPLKQH